MDTGARKYKIGFDRSTVGRVQAFESKCTTHIALIMKDKAIWYSGDPTHVCLYTSGYTLAAACMELLTTLVSLTFSR